MENAAQLIVRSVSNDLYRSNGRIDREAGHAVVILSSCVRYELAEHVLLRNGRPIAGEHVAGNSRLLDFIDEFDIEDAIVRQINECTFVVSGRVDIDDLKERIAINLEDGDYETVAGYLLERLGTIPAPNDEFVINGYRFIILKASANRVDLVKIIKES